MFILTSAFGRLVAFFIAASLHQITPGFGLWATVKGQIVMILGGIGSIPGAIPGGLLLGVIELQALWYLGGGFRDLVAFLVLFNFFWSPVRGGSWVPPRRANSPPSGESNGAIANHVSHEALNPPSREPGLPNSGGACACARGRWESAG